MGKKIIVAGLGHGGIAAAALLSKSGYDVTVYEKKAEGTLGYDWTDIFAPDAFAIAGIPMPDESKYTFKEDMMFFGPSVTRGYRQHVERNNLEIKMERRDIYEHLIKHAVKCGVKIEYNCEVKAPLLLGGRVVGIKTEKGDFYADLIIDACGMNSPVRCNLPSALGIEKEIARNEKITIYRAFYNKASDEEVEDKFKVMICTGGKTGVTWVASEDDFTDILIGRFEDFDINEVNAFTDYLRQSNPTLGTQVVRGGQFVEIPTRQPLAMMVADGYAAIGDSAFMTVPIIGSGIANSLKAARMLSDAVNADKDDLFTAETLWKYQYSYYRRLGSGLAPLANAKLLLLKLTNEEIDYIFESGMITEDNITIGADFTSYAKIHLEPQELITKAKLVCSDTVLLKKIIACGLSMARTIGMCAVIPPRYDPVKCRNWAKMYLKSFK
ncbi:MAG: hypothetical protein K6B52_04490 [Clostridiales bacterium]|nr:hypothetical protein [Clostridiales bacterium]